LISAKLENLVAIVLEVPQEASEFGLKIAIRKIEDCDWKLKVGFKVMSIVLELQIIINSILSLFEY
jgi:hypothetical protein